MAAILQLEKKDEKEGSGERLKRCHISQYYHIVAQSYFFLNLKKSNQNQNENYDLFSNQIGIKSQSPGSLRGAAVHKEGH